jgi:hypothetical protein
MDSPTLCIDDPTTVHKTSELGKATPESQGLLRQARVERLHRDKRCYEETFGRGCSAGVQTGRH